MMGWEWGHPMAWTGWLFMAAVWVLVVMGIIWLGRALLQAREAPERDSNRAEAILEERYARGEISADELRRMRKELWEGRDRS